MDDGNGDGVRVGWPGWLDQGLMLQKYDGHVRQFGGTVVMWAHGSVYPRRRLL